MSDDAAAARERLAERQAAVVAALAGRGTAPAGFDQDRITLTGETLASKRRKGVARAWPVLPDSLGANFAPLFATFTSDHPPHPDGPAADAFAFARWLDAKHMLPPEAAPVLFATALRSGLPVAARIRRQSPRRLLVGVRFPCLGVRVVSLPWPAIL